MSSCRDLPERVQQKGAQSFLVLGVRLDAVQIPEVVQEIEGWIEEGKDGGFIAVANTHVVMESRQDVSFKQLINSADLCVPDGMPKNKRRGLG